MQLTKSAMLDARVDGELVHLARSGDITSLGHLLERHRASMLAVALAMLGRPAEAQDAVQDAMLVALSRIGDLRDPAAAGPWLKMIVRNRCRMTLRVRQPVSLANVPDRTLGHGTADPARMLDRLAVRDWVWHAVERLSPPLRVVTMLRYFTEVNTYEQISAMCGVPVGTVRSRLNKARRRLSQELVTAATASHHDIAALTAASRKTALDGLALAEQDRFDEFLDDMWHPEVETLWADGTQSHGFAPALQMMRAACEARVGMWVTDVVASREIVIWGIDVVNPVDDPFHCPERPFWLLFLEDGRVRRARLFGS